jgi:hypothetical protein
MHPFHSLRFAPARRARRRTGVVTSCSPGWPTLDPLSNLILPTSPALLGIPTRIVGPLRIALSG